MGGEDNCPLSRATVTARASGRHMPGGHFFLGPEPRPRRRPRGSGEEREGAAGHRPPWGETPGGRMSVARNAQLAEHLARAGVANALAGRPYFVTPVLA
jgi:hypothetical protein